MMNKIKTIILTVLVGTVLTNSCDNNSEDLQLPEYPEYKEVITLFLSDYSISQIEYPNQFQLAKKPTGWHAMIVDATDETIMQDNLFWDRKTRKFNPTSFPPAQDGRGVSAYSVMIDDWRNNYFNAISPYWGYVGWTDDVIKEFGKKSNLSDTLLNALARAYSTTAFDILNKESSAPLKKQFTDEQFANYKKYGHLGTETYYKLWEKNPDFETFIADVYNVYSNQVMTNYLTLLYSQNQTEALKELKEGLYDDFYRDMAKRLLSSCDENGILFVNGDSDTFPLLYVQENEGFRKDVTVINLSLMNSGKYISHLLRDFPGRDPLSCTIADSIYRDGSIPYLFIVDKLNSIEFNKLMKFVQSSDPRSKYLSNGEYYDYIPTKKINLNFSIDNLSKIYPTIAEINTNQDSQLTIDLDKKYIYLNHLCLIDIIGTNILERPIYFSITVGKDNYLGLSDHFQCEGLAYKLMPLKMTATTKNYDYGIINTGIQFEKLIKNKSITSLDPSQKYYESHKRMIRIYRNTYSRLVKQLISEEKFGQALEVLDYYNNNFGSDKVEHDFYSLGIIESYYQLDLPAKANKIVEELLQASIRDHADISIEENDKMRIQYTLNELSQLTSTYIFDSELNHTVNETLESLLPITEN